MQFAKQTRRAEREISERPQLPLVKPHLIDETEDQQCFQQRRRTVPAGANYREVKSKAYVMYKATARVSKKRCTLSQRKTPRLMSKRSQPPNNPSNAQEQPTKPFSAYSKAKKRNQSHNVQRPHTGRSSAPDNA